MIKTESGIKLHCNYIRLIRALGRLRFYTTHLCRVMQASLCCLAGQMKSLGMARSPGIFARIRGEGLEG